MKPRTKLLALVFAFLLALPAAADTAAHPSLWHVKGPRGEAWLFGSVHVLPPGIDWRGPVIKDALSKADVFVFEVSQDPAAMARVRQLVAEKGYLPQGVSLRDLLHPGMQPKFDAAVAEAGLPPEQVNRERPWLAGLQMLLAQMGQHQFGTGDGVDPVLMEEARTTGRKMRYLETVDQQFALLAPDDPALELDEFEAGLSDLADTEAMVQPLLEAWEHGDQDRLAKIVAEDMADFPAAKKALFDDRNARWVPKIEAMLKQKHRFFITVGAGHLAGPSGVPALLRKAGYQVDGP
ncbi:MAG: hypothetical protein BGN85_04695 [Alphaproteobacteria bacterium 64-11]|nr:TraB/GumN family protein [Alphaproteobacteria bacterium]OJU10276.1 MAG: hypothetical protein BGN85_04695 [Alphaproteobacteria bacterium 64-11]